MIHLRIGYAANRPFCASLPFERDASAKGPIAACFSRIMLWLFRIEHSLFLFRDAATVV
jgi:hypothetical protein